MSKYPRTYHFNWSPGSTNDDRISDSVDHLIGIDIPQLPKMVSMEDLMLILVKIHGIEKCGIFIIK